MTQCDQITSLYMVQIVVMWRARANYHSWVSFWRKLGRDKVFICLLCLSKINWVFRTAKSSPHGIKLMMSSSNKVAAAWSICGHLLQCAFLAVQSSPTHSIYCVLKMIERIGRIRQSTQVCELKSGNANCPLRNLNRFISHLRFHITRTNNHNAPLRSKESLCANTSLFECLKSSWAPARECQAHALVAKHWITARRAHTIGQLTTALLANHCTGGANTPPPLNPPLTRHPGRDRKGWRLEEVTRLVWV